MCRSTEITGALLSVTLAVLLLVASVLGPLVSGRVRFHMSPEALSQYVGGEVVTVVVAAALLASGPGWYGGHHWPAAVDSGAAAYVVYTFVTVVGGQQYGRYEGNAEKAFLLYAAITAAAVALAAISSWRLAAGGTVDAAPRHQTSWVLIATAVVVSLLWVGQIAGFYRNGATDEYESATALFWLIKYLDLGVVVPLAVITGLRQHSPSPGADAAAVTLLGFFIFLFAALVCMAAEMLRRDEPGASPVVALGAVVLLVPSAVLWARWLMRSR